MKKYIVVAILLISAAIPTWAQESKTAGFPMLGEDAPSFSAESTEGPVNFPGDYSGSWKILFSHPADFTPVCTSEILELAEAQKDFEKFKTRLVVVSVDPLATHREWKKSMESIRLSDREPSTIGFPLVSDENLVISRAYGMIHPSTSSTRAVRGVFIVDPKDKIRAMFYYPMNIGRNTGEIQRTLIALQTADKQEVMTPANWQPGGDVLLPFVKSPDEASRLISKDDPDYYQPVWYMMYKRGTK